jgi:hypothetical protein
MLHQLRLQFPKNAHFGDTTTPGKCATSGYGKTNQWELNVLLSVLSACHVCSKAVFSGFSISHILGSLNFTFET